MNYATLRRIYVRPRIIIRLDMKSSYRVAPIPDMFYTKHRVTTSPHHLYPALRRNDGHIESKNCSTNRVYQRTNVEVRM